MSLFHLLTLKLFALEATNSNIIRHSRDQDKSEQTNVGAILFVVVIDVFGKNIAFSNVDTETCRQVTINIPSSHNYTARILNPSSSHMNVHW